MSGVTMAEEAADVERGDNLANTGSEERRADGDP